MEGDHRYLMTSVDEGGGLLGDAGVVLEGVLDEHANFHEWKYRGFWLSGSVLHE